MRNDTTHSAADESLQILLVEDNPGDVRLIQEAVKTTDHEITLNIVRDGDTAVETLLRLEQDEPVPDLVLLDLNLPGRDGFAVLDAIREDTDVHTLPVVILSSSSADEDIRQCYAAKANAYLTKPGTLPELTSMMQTVEDFWVEQARLPPMQA